MAGWTLTDTAYWSESMGRRAEENEDYSLGSLCQLLVDLEDALSPQETDTLEEILERCEAKYHPQPNEVAYYYPRNSSHQMLPSVFMLAVKMHPQVKDFVARVNDRHATVYSPSLNVYFDALLTQEEVQEVMAYGFQTFTLEQLEARARANEPL